MGTQLAGKTLGIVGLGRIGQAVAARARALEMGCSDTTPFCPRIGPRNWGSKSAPRCPRCCRRGLPHRAYPADRRDARTGRQREHLKLRPA